MNLKIKYFLLFLIFGQLTNEVYSQTSNCTDYKLEKIHSISKLKSTNRLNSSINFYIEEFNIKYLYKIKGKFILEELNLNSGKKKTIKIKNKIINSLTMSSYLKFSVNSDTLTISNVTDIYQYLIYSNKLIFQKNVQSIEYCKHYKGHIYYGRFYYHNFVNVNFNAMVYKYNIASSSLDSINLNQNFMEYTHYLPSNFIDFGQSKFVYPDFGSYKIYLQDYKDSKIDSITRKNIDWISPSISLSNSIKKSKDVNLYFPLLDNESFNHISRIEHIEFIDSNKLLVRWYKFDTSLKFNIRFIDIWLVDKVETKLLSSCQETNFPINLKDSINKVGIPLFSQNYYTKYYKNYIIQVRSDVNINPYNYTNYKSYLIEREKFARKNDPNITFWIFKKI